MTRAALWLRQIPEGDAGVSAHALLAAFKVARPADGGVGEA